MTAIFYEAAVRCEGENDKYPSSKIDIRWDCFQEFE